MPQQAIAEHLDATTETPRQTCLTITLPHEISTPGILAPNFEESVEFGALRRHRDTRFFTCSTHDGKSRSYAAMRTVGVHRVTFAICASINSPVILNKVMLSHLLDVATQSHSISIVGIAFPEDDDFYKYAKRLGFRCMFCEQDKGVQLFKNLNIAKK